METNDIVGNIRFTKTSPGPKTFFNTEILSGQKRSLQLKEKGPQIKIERLALRDFAEEEKMTGGTPEVRSDKNLTLLTFDIQPMDQWTNGAVEQWSNVLWSDKPKDQWTNGPMVQWTNGPKDQWTNGPMD